MFSVVIPTYKEEKYIGRLLESIKKQTLQPAEIIIADRPSGDKTREIAKKYGCKVVEGGIIPVGRNNGAKAAKSPILIFLDADCVVHRKDFFNKAIGKFISSNSDIASCFTRDIMEKNGFPIPTQGFINGVRFLNMITLPLFNKFNAEGGACIIVKKTCYEKLHGFNEKLKTYEDADFFKRAVKKDMKYRVIPVTLATSNRRYSLRTGKSLITALAVTGIAGLAFIFGSKNFKKYKKKFDESMGEMGGS